MQQRTRRPYRFWTCFCQDAVQTKDDESADSTPSDKSGLGSSARQQAVFVVECQPSESPASSSGGGAPSRAEETCSRSSSVSDSSTDDAIWYDCTEEWDSDDTQESSQPSIPAGIDGARCQQPSSTPLTGSRNALELTKQQWDAVQALPVGLGRIVSSYLQGVDHGCKPTVAVKRWMQKNGMSLDQVQELLQPLLAAEADAPEQMPVLTPCLAPAALTEQLRSQMFAQAVATIQGSSSQPQPRLHHLLDNLQLLHETLAVMDQEEFFKQVSGGPLEMWYAHDTALRRQMIRCKVTLNEPLSVITTVIREVDLVCSWNPGMSDMHELASYSPTELLVYVLMWMPWPLPMPEVVNYGLGLDLLDCQEHCVLVATGSKPLPEGVQMPKHSRTIPLKMHAGGFKLVPLPPDPQHPDLPRTEVTVMVSIDAARFTVPDSIISFVLKVFAPLVYRSVMKVFRRMFHHTAAASGSTPADFSRMPSTASESEAGAAASGGGAAQSSSMLVERLALRQEYAALDAHAKRYLTAQAANQA